MYIALYFFKVLTIKQYSFFYFINNNAPKNIVGLYKSAVM